MATYKILFLAVFFLLLNGCAGGVNSLRQELKGELKDLRGVQAEQTAAISEIRDELRRVNGKLEELSYASQGKTRELENTIRQLGTRVPPPAGVPDDLLSQDEQLIAPITGTAADNYREALARLRAGDFPGARDILTTFIETNPGTAFTDNAMFWLGICQRSLGSPEKGVVSFSDVFQKYPAEDMVAPAMYYLADTLLQMNAREDAILAFERLADEQPRSPYAARARERLRELKPGSAVRGSTKRRGG